MSGLRLEQFSGKADVYKNLHRGCWSVRSRERGDRYGRVVAHLDDVLVEDARFVVSQAGRRRVIAEGRKNVHAYVRGLVDIDPDRTCFRGFARGDDPDRPYGVPVSYSPYDVSGSFRRSGTDNVVESADCVMLSMSASRPVVGWGVTYARK